MLTNTMLIGRQHSVSRKDNHTPRENVERSVESKAGNETIVVRGEKRVGSVSSRAKRRGNPWQRHIFPKSRPLSIVCAGAFHFRVRDGNGWFHSALVTRRILSEGSIHY